MKISRIIGVALMLVLVLALALSVTACKDDNKDPDPTPTPTPTPTPDPELEVITGITFEGASFTYDGEPKSIAISGTLPDGVTVTYEGNGAVDAGVHTVTATLSGEGYKTLSLPALLTITKADMLLSFPKGEFVYDGSEKSISVSGSIPEGAEVKYESNAATNAGTYTAKVTVTHKNYNDFVASAPLIIAKADITGVSLESGSFTYDGEAKSIAVSGTLPEGVTVTYDGNGVSAVGSHPVSATLSGENYNTLTLSAFIIIAEDDPGEIEITGVTLNKLECVYDGSAKSITVSGNIPDGVEVSYAGNGQVNAGTYTVTAVLSGKGYKTLTLSAELKINKATVSGITLEDGSFNYTEGVYHSLEIGGTLPEGVTVEYTGNNVTYAGTYKVTAVISGENYETLVLEATLTVKGQGGSGLLTPIHPFN